MDSVHIIGAQEITHLMRIAIRWKLSDVDIASMLGREGENMAPILARGVASLAQADVEDTAEHEWVRCYRSDLGDSPLGIMEKGTMFQLEYLENWMRIAAGG